ncbi:MAG: DUF998 domain-containing protein [Archaeoglobaceae archaeon]|nr:DUF998 domain-containing protein [Archaeoglobaceae archaeon]
MILAIGSLQFIVAMLIAEQLYPNYNPLVNYISDLGALKAPTALLFNTSVFLLGLLGFVAAILLKKEIGVSLIFLILASVGSMGVGLFPEDYPLPHIVSALMAFLFGAVATIGIGRKIGKFYKPFGTVLGSISLIALILFVLRVETPLGIGGMERLIAYPVLIFFIVYGLGAMKAR